MSFRHMLRKMLSERRAFDVNSLDWQYRTEAARKYIHAIRGVPAKDWNK